MRRAAGQTRAFHSLDRDDWWEKFLKDLRRCLVEVGSAGLTHEEAARALGGNATPEKHGNISAGFTYLARRGQAFKSHRTRRRGKTQGSPAIVWVAERAYIDAAANPTQERLL